MDALSDDELMTLVASGDRKSFARILKRHEKSLRARCWAILPYYDDALDAFQRTSIKIWDNRGKYKPGGNVLNYFYTVATTTCIDTWRYRVRLTLRVGSSAAMPRFMMPAEDYQISALDAASIREDVLALPSKYSSTLLLHLVEGLSFAEIAEIQRIGEEKVCNRFRYALKKFEARRAKRAKKGRN